MWSFQKLWIIRTLLGSNIGLRRMCTVKSVPKWSNLKTIKLSDKKPVGDLSEFEAARVRNFSIIAHIDHGKSTLADRLLEFTGTIEIGDNKQVLDKLEVERERGITVKAQTASMIYTYKNTRYLLNLIDTPGHVDFSYEVSRSLHACQGVILLVDANQGVEAQTVANFFLAFEAESYILPVLNKIDLPKAKPDKTKEQLLNLFEIEPCTVLSVSSKLGTGIEELLTAVVTNLPPPSGDRDMPLKCLVFDCWYEEFTGAVIMVSVINGSVREGDEIKSCHTGKTYLVKSVGIMSPDVINVSCLYAGQVGCITCNMRVVSEAQIGDTLHEASTPVQPYPGFKQPKPMVFAGMYPLEQTLYDDLKKSIDRLALNDRSISIDSESNEALGHGFRLGFLGILHMEVFHQRLEQEYDAVMVLTAPSVPYKAILKHEKHIKEFRSKEVMIYTPSKFLDRQLVEEYQEPMVLGTVIIPAEYMSNVISLCQGKRGEQKECVYIDQNRIILKYLLPLNEIIVDFFDLLKAVTSGYGSFDYEDYGYQTTDIVKLDFLLNGKPLEELSQICHALSARRIAKSICAKLKETIHGQQYKIAIQGCVNSKIIAREDIKALKKDVTAKLYGGDRTRRTKLLRYQAEGKKRMRTLGNVEIPRDVFIKVLRHSTK